MSDAEAAVKIPDATVIVDGQITIPAVLRRAHGIVTGQYVEVRVRTDRGVRVIENPVRAKGRVTIPVEARDALGIEVGDEIIAELTSL